MNKITLSLDEVEQTTQAALLAHGASEEAASAVAYAVRIAEAKGNLICGLYYLESYCTQLTSGRVQGQVVAEVSQPKTASVKVDAKLGFAQPAFAPGQPH